MAGKDGDARKNEFVAGILEEVGDYLENSPRDPATGVKLGANISNLARQYEGDLLDSLARRGGERLKERAARRRNKNKTGE